MTVREITVGELEKLRGGGQYSEVFVIPRVPNVMYSAQLAAVPATHDMVASITVTSGVGDIADVRLDMKMLVGSLPGGDDIGFCRVRDLPDVDIYGDGTFYIGELSHIDWQADYFITIVDDYDIFPRPIRIVKGEALIDWGVDYDHQHEAFEPIVNMGGHRVLFLDPDTGLVSHVRNCTDEGSMVFDGTIASYLWESPNALSVTDETTEEATFEYDTAGHFVEYCTLTTDDGESFTGVRYVFIVDPATLESDIHSLKVNESKDGVSISFDMTANAKTTDFRHRAFVIAFSVDYYGGVKETISYRQNEGNILGSGRIAEERIEFNDEIGTVRFSTGDFKYWMKKISAFPFGLERATKTPTVWTSMPGLNVDRAAWELLHRYCTVTRIADIHLSGDTRYAEELASTSSNLVSQLEEVILTTIYADLVFDTFGVGWLRIEPQLVIDSERTSRPVVQAISSDDWENSLSVELNTYDEVSQMNSSGVSVEKFGSARARISLSYGHIYSPFGDASTTGNLLLGGQGQSNSIAGLFMGWHNRKFDALSFSFVGNHRMFSLAEYCRASMVISAASNPRGVSYSGFLVPQSISRSWEESSGFINTVIEFQDESIEQLSIIGDFPPKTEIDDDIPDFPLPLIPIPVLPPIILPPIEENLTKPKTIILGTSLGVLYTENADADTEAEVEWIFMNEGLSALERAEINNIVVAPCGTLYLLTQNTTVYYADGLGAAWTQLWDINDYPNQPAFIAAIGINPNEDDTIAIHGGRVWTISPLDFGMSYVCVGNKRGLGSINNIIEFHPYPGTVLYNNNGWTLMLSGIGGMLGSTPTSRLIRCTASGALQTATGVPGGEGPMGASEQYGFAIGTSDRTLQWVSQQAYNYGFFDFSDITPANITGFNPKGRQAMSFSPTGVFGMGTDGVDFTPKLTTDSGATWSSLGGAIPVGSDVFENCKDDNRWVFGGGSTIRATITQGTDYYGINGNFNYIASTADISIIRFMQ